MKYLLIFLFIYSLVVTVIAFWVAANTGKMIEQDRKNNRNNHSQNREN